VSAVRGRRLTAIIAAGLLALAAAGCGNDETLAPEVPGPPADVVLPESTVAPAADENADSADQDSTTDEGTTDDTTTPEDSGATGDTGATTPDTSGGGTAAPDAEADSPTNDTPPPADSEAEQFEDFCAQNPGAC
jgi:putative serine protease PepD